MATQATKPYVKLASTLVLFGMALFALERFGLSHLEDPKHPMHLDGTLLSLMVLVPMVMVLAGAIIFVVGRMRRL